MKNALIYLIRGSKLKKDKELGPMRLLFYFLITFTQKRLNYLQKKNFDDLLYILELASSRSPYNFDISLRLYL